MNTFVIAEIGVNHNGKLDLALELVEAAAAAGADAAKFQTFRADAITVRNTATVAYQKSSGADDQHAMLKALELGEDEHAVLAERCREIGIEFMSTAFDPHSLDLLCRLGIRRIKVPSGEVNNVPYLRDCALRGLPIILSTGMADMDEVSRAVDVLRETMPSLPDEDEHGQPPLIVLHCTSAYPTAPDDVNLRAMQTMGAVLKVPVGYSDHTEGTFVSPTAVALGARVIEKHLTLDRGMQGPDHAASIEPSEFKAMVAQIREAELILGDGIKAPRPAELEARSLVRRGLKARRDIPAGTVLVADDIAIMRPATGLPPERYDDVQGRRLSITLKAGEPLESSHLD
ncbi:N-acetylneuraminate synthase [Mesorhizobium sp. RP14(2022)]|uniref:N-acetylneuraminate synthase n=1 Tax=Mesorhizobium liriopis TaxID=2953882 RepID=A0ABT1C7H6_9HYPH|nr:N-acetylneuraminate synthase [Mesorhizobium liriopis]MCO6050165.1 N-acetylneuraminate synthase [Mesorhizobium liriopis]